MPTWYYFSRPSNMAFHDFTKRHKPQKNLRSLLGLGLKFIPTPSLTNCWSRLKQSSYERLFRSVHLRFHFAGKPPSKGSPLDMDTTTLDHTPYCAGGTLNTLLFSTQQTFQDATRQNKPVTSSTSRPTNVTTTANVSHRPV